MEGWDLTYLHLRDKKFGGNEKGCAGGFEEFG